MVVPVPVVVVVPVPVPVVVVVAVAVAVVAQHDAYAVHAFCSARQKRGRCLAMVRSLQFRNGSATICLESRSDPT